MVRGLKNPIVIVMCVTTLLLTGCGKKEEPQETRTAAEPKTTAANAPQAVTPGTTPAVAPTEVETNPEAEMAVAAARTEKTLKELSQGKTVEPISVDILKGLLPAELPGMKRTDSSAQHHDMMGVKAAVAEAQYEAADGAGSIQVMILDTGNLSGPMRIGMTAWTVGQYSRETENGYEKTTTYAGYKGAEEYDKQAQSGALRIFVANRFVVEVEGTGTTMEAIKEAMGKIDLKKLAASGS